MHRLKLGSMRVWNVVTLTPFIYKHAHPEIHIKPPEPRARELTHPLTVLRLRRDRLLCSLHQLLHSST